MQINSISKPINSQESIPFTNCASDSESKAVVFKIISAIKTIEVFMDIIFTVVYPRKLLKMKTICIREFPEIKKSGKTLSL